jgi:hypothetical protein
MAYQTGRKAEQAVHEYCGYWYSWQILEEIVPAVLQGRRSTNNCL